MKKKIAAFGLFLALAAQAALGGRRVFETVATVESVHLDHSWINGETGDVYMRGADGKVFLLHFHGHNALESLEGRRVKVVYVQKVTDCETGFTDDTVSITVIL